MLVKLPELTTVNESEKGNFIMLMNDITHEVSLLQEPEYVPADYVDNTEYDAEHNQTRFVSDDVELKTTEPFQMKAYHTNVAALMQLGNWFDYLMKK